jgi:hypothetical protein
MSLFCDYGLSTWCRFFSLACQDVYITGNPQITYFKTKYTDVDKSILLDELDINIDEIGSEDVQMELLLNPNDIISNKYNNIKYHLQKSYNIVETDLLQYDVAHCVNPNNQLNEYTCCICLYLLNDPILLPCNHTICNNCIDSIKNNSCPICRRKYNLNNIIVDQNMKNIMDNIDVNCPNCNNIHKSTEQCTTADCDILVECKYCGHEMKKCDFSVHYVMCVLRKCYCCDKYTLKSHMADHLHSCKKCDNCGFSKFKYMENGIHICHKKCLDCNQLIKLEKTNIHNFKCKQNQNITKNKLIKK